MQAVDGTAVGASVSSGGSQMVSSGGVAIGATVKHGGSQTVLSGGATSGTVLSGGEVVSAGGRANSTTVRSGGSEIVHGRASGGVISGGLFEVASGGTASGTVTFVSGGTLQLDAGAGFTAVIKNFGKPDRIDLRGIPFKAGVTTESFVQTTTKSGTLTVSGGGHSVHLTLLGAYTTSSFKLATDGKGGTLVTDPPVAGGGASQTTFADIAPAGPHTGAATPTDPLSYLSLAIAGNEHAHAGQTLLATAPSGEPGGGSHNPLLPAGGR